MIIASFILLYGTVEFLEKKLHPVWWFITVITIGISSIATLAALPFYLRVLPACLFIGAVYCWTGILLLRHAGIQGWGKNITGAAFIILGIHMMDLPFFIEVAWFAPFGFMLDAALRLMIAIGTLIVYFEKTRRDLEVKEKHYRLLAENAVDVIYRYRLAPLAGFEYISPSITKLTGYSPEEFQARADIMRTIVYPDDWPLLEMVMADVAAAVQPLVMRFVHRDGRAIWVEQTLAPLLSEDGSCVGFEGIVRDVSARKALEQDVARLESLNAVGQMAASMAHEVRNPMTTISGYLQIFSRKKEFVNYQGQLNQLLAELDRINQIIKEYLALSQNKMADMRLVQLNTIIESLYPLVTADAVAACKEIVLDLGDIPAVYIDAKEIRQLILNLVRNGLEAMDDTGYSLTLRTYADNDAVVFTVRDQGKGIPQNVLANLGRPFFTTKQNGTGLGLATCYRIANRHQAKIEVDTSSRGTTFIVRFKIPKEI
ncbi:MAG TPA: ATP-binding protein [Methylomusa anaerophila]|nr:ATP-binding protein [Methylomusa anaerophila]HML88183.1 ATP-binding protein [Methylomusa anaerophila]